MSSQPHTKEELVEQFFLSEQNFNIFKQLFKRVGNIPNDSKVTQFCSQFKPF